MVAKIGRIEFGDSLKRNAAEMSQRGYNDDLTIQKVKAYMSANPGVSRRNAIITVAGEDNLRRIEIKMRAEERSLRAERRQEIIDEHARRHPTYFESSGVRTCFAVVSPSASPGTTKIYTGVIVRAARSALGAAKAEGLVLDAPNSGNISWMEEIATAGGLIDAIDALGLSFHRIDGVVSPQGASPVLQALAETLKIRWTEAGVGDDDDTVTALACEAQRLDKGGLSEISDLIPAELRQLAAVYVGPGQFGLSDLPSRLDPARLALLVKLAVFAHPALMAMTDDEIRKWTGRPVECLAYHLNEGILPALDLDRRLDLADADWLLSVFGEKSIVPIAPRVLELLVRWHGSLDLDRIVSNQDAAGIVAMIEAILERDPWGQRREAVDDGLRLLFARLREGRDATRPYGEIAAALRSLAPPDQVRKAEPLNQDTDDAIVLSPFADAVLSFTVGVEHLCASVARELVAPTIIWKCVVTEGGDAPGVADYLREMLTAGDHWSSRIEQQIREIVLGGRCAEDLLQAVLLTNCDLRAASADPFRLSAKTLGLCADKWSSPRRTDREINDAWLRLEPAVAPQWRSRGRRMVEDQFRPLIRNVIEGRRPKETETFERTWRRMVRRWSTRKSELNRPILGASGARQN